MIFTGNMYQMQTTAQNKVGWIAPRYGVTHFDFRVKSCQQVSLFLDTHPDEPQAQERAAFEIRIGVPVDVAMACQIVDLKTGSVVAENADMANMISCNEFKEFRIDWTLGEITLYIKDLLQDDVTVSHDAGSLWTPVSILLSSKDSAFWNFYFNQGKWILNCHGIHKSNSYVAKTYIVYSS